MMFAVIPFALGWVLFSPVDRSSSPNQFVAYEPLLDGIHTPWVNADSWPLDTVAIRWSLPPQATSDDGLGGGITFALHREFCSRLIDLFPEHQGEARLFGDFFLSCTDLRNTVKRAMDTWAINHKNINFKDVTEDCEDVESTDECPAAELFIVPQDLVSSKEGDLAAWVNHNLGSDSLDRAPWTTAGFQLPLDRFDIYEKPGGLGVRRAKMTIRAPLSRDDFCWYLDSSFCYYFHRWEQGWDVVLTGRIICAVIFGGAFIVTLWVVLSIAYAVCCGETRQVILVVHPDCYALPSTHSPSMPHHSSESGSCQPPGLADCLPAVRELVRQLQALRGP